MTGYTKLFSSIIVSTIWRESKDTKILWITMLALRNRDNVVEGCIPGLADMARLTVPETEMALKVLESPDPYSRTKAFEGRRIKTIEGGWFIINAAKYRSLMSQEDHRQYQREWERKNRPNRPNFKYRQPDLPPMSPPTKSHLPPISELHDVNCNARLDDSAVLPPIFTPDTPDKTRHSTETEAKTKTKKGKYDRGTSNTPGSENGSHIATLSPSVLILRQHELKRVEDRLKNLRDNNKAPWPKDARAECERLQTRRAQLITLLDLSV